METEEGFFQNNLMPITILFDNYLNGFISKEDYFNFMKTESDKRDLELSNDFNNATTWKNLPIRKILHISERLRLVDQLQKSVSINPENDWDLGQKKAFYPDLEIYLLLTCFDILGQSKGFRLFPDWLTSKKHSVKHERDVIISNIHIEDKAEFSIALYSEYSKKYGVKCSFFDFLYKLIDKETQDNLLQSLRFSKGYNEIKGTEEEKDLKFSFLYELRNGYTHSSFPPSEFPFFIKVNEEEIWRKSFKKEDFIKVLKATVVKGIVAFINKLKDNLEI